MEDPLRIPDTVAETSAIEASVHPPVRTGELVAEDRGKWFTVQVMVDTVLKP
jgi:hypothetical protein